PVDVVARDVAVHCRCAWLRVLVGNRQWRGLQVGAAILSKRGWDGYRAGGSNGWARRILSTLAIGFFPRSPAHRLARFRAAGFSFSSSMAHQCCDFSDQAAD